MLVLLFAVACGDSEVAPAPVPSGVPGPSDSTPAASATPPVEPATTTEAPGVPTPSLQPTVTEAPGDPTPPVEPTATTGAPGDPTPPVEPTATTGAIPRGELPVIEFVRADGSLAPLPVEVPPRSEYGIGLSGRYTLDERGMLFHYSSPEGRHTFWMLNTHIDLSIAFVSGDLRVVEIRAMEADSLDRITPEVDHQYVVEAPAGWYAQHGIEVGDEVRFLFELPP